MSYRVVQQVLASPAGVQSAAERLVLVVLAEAARNDGVTWLGQQTIARRSGVTEQTVRASLRRLEQAGRVEQRKATYRGTRINVYRVLVAGADEPDCGWLRKHGVTLDEPFTTANIPRSPDRVDDPDDRKFFDGTTADSSSNPEPATSYRGNRKKNRKKSTSAAAAAARLVAACGDCTPGTVERWLHIFGGDINERGFAAAADVIEKKRDSGELAGSPAAYAHGVLSWMQAGYGGDDVLTAVALAALDARDSQLVQDAARDPVAHTELRDMFEDFPRTGAPGDVIGLADADFIDVTDGGEHNADKGSDGKHMPEPEPDPEPEPAPEVVPGFENTPLHALMQRAQRAAESPRGGRMTDHAGDGGRVAHAGMRRPPNEPPTANAIPTPPTRAPREGTHAP